MYDQTRRASHEDGAKRRRRGEKRVVDAACGWDTDRGAQIETEGWKAVMLECALARSRTGGGKRRHARFWRTARATDREDRTVERTQPMIDTIAAFVVPRRLIGDDHFTGGALQFDFASGSVTARLWANALDDDYVPRVTYWRPARSLEGYKLDADNVQDPPEDIPEFGLFKVEFSVPKILERIYGSAAVTSNIAIADAFDALRWVDEWLVRFGDFPPLMTWRLQRVDYAWMWHVGELLPAYMSVFNKLRIGNWSRHPFDVVEGVVWKSGNRWVKFYNKSLQMGSKSAKDYILRYEVSNYRDACRYMADTWFNTERDVGEFLHEGRALYTLAVSWDALGMVLGDHYGESELELTRIVQAFPSRAAQAYYVLMLFRQYGREAHTLGLITKSKYYRYLRDLAREGFLCVRDDVTNDEDSKYDDVLREPLSVLHLPVYRVLSLINDDENAQNRHNLRDVSPENPYSPSIFAGLNWENLQKKLGLAAGKQSNYLLERARLWAGETEDGLPRLRLLHESA